MSVDGLIYFVSGLAGGLAGAIAHAKRLESKLLPFFKGAVHVVHDIEQSQAAKKALDEAKAALEKESGAERDALMKAAAHSAVAALGVEVAQLTDIQKAAIAGYIADVVPDRYKSEVTPAKVSDTLAMIQAEIEAAKAHDGVKAAQAFVAWLAAGSGVATEQK